MLLLCYVFFSTSFVKAQCVATSKSAATAISVSYTGSNWSFDNPTNVIAPDAANATAGGILSVLNSKTEHLQATSFGFSIPTAATICGIEVNVVKHAENTLLSLSYVTDDTVRLLKANTRTGTDWGDRTTKWPSTETTTSYGSSNELWGTTWSPTDINSGNFGISFSAKIHDAAALMPSASINYISITVYYLDPTVLSAQALQFQVANGANHSAALSWKLNTADEGETFSIERSVNGMKWQPVQGMPQLNFNAAMFTFTDAQPLPGQSFYRLRITSASREVHYSTVQPFEYMGDISLKCYPNPVSTIVQVAGVIPGERVVLTDLYGKCLFLSAPAKNTIIQLDMAHLQPGMYVISTGNRKMKIQKK